MINPPKQRCSADHPPLAEVIRAVSPASPPQIRSDLDRLSEELQYRTGFRPDDVTVPAIGAALVRVRQSMIDAAIFTQRHGAALSYFGVTE